MTEAEIATGSDSRLDLISRGVSAGPILPWDTVAQNLVPQLNVDDPRETSSAALIRPRVGA